MFPDADPLPIFNLQRGSLRHVGSRIVRPISPLCTPEYFRLVIMSNKQLKIRVGGIKKGVHPQKSPVLSGVQREIPCLATGGEAVWPDPPPN